MNHRHHCRICGKGHFCDKCAPRRSQLFNLRICNGCYEKNSSNDLLDRAYLKVEDLNDDILLLVIMDARKQEWEIIVLVYFLILKLYVIKL